MYICRYIHIHSDRCLIRITTAPRAGPREKTTIDISVRLNI